MIQRDEQYDTFVTGCTSTVSWLWRSKYFKHMMHYKESEVPQKGLESCQVCLIYVLKDQLHLTPYHTALHCGKMRSITFCWAVPSRGLTWELLSTRCPHVFGGFTSSSSESSCSPWCTWEGIFLILHYLNFVSLQLCLAIELKLNL